MGKCARAATGTLLQDPGVSEKARCAVNGHVNPVLRHIRRIAVLGGSNDRTDSHLLHCFVTQRDEAAFEALVRRHGPMVLAVCRRILTDPHDADDAFQATFLVLVRRAAAIENQESLGSFLHGVALRTALNARADLTNRRKHERRAVPMPAVDEESEVVWRDLRTMLDEEIQRLSEPYRTLVVLCYLEGKSYAEAAARLGCSRGTVSTRLTKARAVLRKQLLSRGLTLSAGALGLVLTRQAAAAALPLPLVLTTVNTVVGLAVSAKVASLTEGVLKAMSMTRLKITLFLLLLGAVGAGGSGLAQYHLRAEEPSNEQGDAFSSRIGEVRTFDGHTERVTWVDFSPDGRRAISSSHDLTVRVWDVATGRELRRLEGHTQRVECAVFSPNGRRALSCSWDGTIRLWDVESGKEILTFAAVGAPGLHIARVAFLPDGKRFLCCPLDHHSLHVRDAQTGQLLKEFGHHEGHVCAVALSRDGSQVLETSCDARRPILLWDVASGRLLREFKDHPEEGAGVALSPDGRLALSASPLQGPIRLWDVASGREIRQMPGHLRGVIALDFSPDGRYALSGGRDQTVRLWHVGTGKELCRFFGHLDWIDRVTFSPDGRQALSSGNDKTIRLWRLPQ
jgi:RNA polymerase sigma factor (sigma-70 family)